MEQIAIVGLGLFGRAWAIVSARAGHEVAVHNSDPASFDRGLEWMGPA